MLFRRKGTHPLADLRDAQRIAATLREADPGTALLDTTRWLESLQQAEADLGSTSRREVIELLEHAGNAHASTLAREVMTGRAADGASAWDSVWRYRGALAVAWLRAFREANGDAKRHQDIPAIGASLLRAISQGLKWGYTGYRPGARPSWDLAFKLYAALDKRHVARLRVDIGFGQRERTSAFDEFMRLLLLAGAGPDGFDPLEVEIADRVAATAAGLCTLTTLGPDGATHWIDLGAPNSPQRTVIPAPATPGLRFIGTEPARLAALSFDTADNLAHAFPEWRVARALERCAERWGPTSRQRRATRAALRTSLQIASNFDDIVDLLDPGLSLSFGGASIEDWLADEASTIGLRALRQGEPTSLRVGALVALKADREPTWTLGVVRRLSRAGDHQMLAGLERIVGQPMAVPVELSNGDGRPVKRDVAILIDPARAGEPPTVVTRPGLYQPGTHMRFTVGGTPIEFAPGSRTARGGVDVLFNSQAVGLPSV